MTDLATTIEPKSDQLNADDLIGRTLTIKITKVTQSSTPDQPIAIHFEGDSNKPYKPCKSMRRVLVQVWGRDGAGYVGKSMTLFRDDSVKWGGVEVGGIRISHMSDIAKDMVFALTASKTVRKQYTVKPLRDSGQKAEGGRPIEPPTVSAAPATDNRQPTTSSEAGDLLTKINDLLKIKCGDGETIDQDAANDFLKGRNPLIMPEAALQKMHEQLVAL